MSPINVSLDQVNYYLSQRQGFDLSRRWDEHSAMEVPPGWYATGKTLFPGVLARYAGFHFQDLQAELYDQRSLFRLRAMRGSAFAVPVRILPAIHQATHPGLLVLYDRLLKQLGIEPAAYAATAGRIVKLVSGQGLTAAELKKALDPLDPQIERGLGFILHKLCAEARLARSRVRGGWKSDQYEYVRFETWLPEIDLQSIEPEQAQVELARLYLAAYGPATPEDFRWWSGLAQPEATRALESLAPELATVEISGLPWENLLLAEDLEGLLSAPGEPAQRASLLPVWDAYLMAYRDRRRYLADEHADFVFDASGNGTSILLVGGRIGGIWDWEEDKDIFTLKAALFFPSLPGLWLELRFAAERLAQEVREKAFKEIRLLHCPAPPALKSAPRNQFLSPLKGLAGEPV
jgi:hypothetical protein